VLRRTKLTEFADALPKQLLGGMKQRVAIAPPWRLTLRLMLTDEPLSALDSKTRELVDGLSDRLWTRQPFTAVYVHAQSAEAVRLGHKNRVLSRRPDKIRRW